MTTEATTATRGCDHLGDSALVAQFEATTLPSADYRHREHLRIAFAMLRGVDLADAAQRFRRAMRRYAAAIGAETRYHETLTWAYLVLVQQRMRDHDDDDSVAFLARNPDLLDHCGGALARCYDVAEITASPIARGIFVLPER